VLLDFRDHHRSEQLHQSRMLRRSLHRLIEDVSTRLMDMRRQRRHIRRRSCLWICGNLLIDTS